jgi:hypothetical protein
MSVASDVVKSLWSKLYVKSSSIYCLKRAFGNSVDNVDIKTYMAFLEASGGNFPDSYKNVCFIVSTMFYNFERPNQAESDSRTFVTFEKLISRIYGKSKSTDKMIRNFIDSDFDSNGIFVNRLVRLSCRCKKELRSGEHLDFNSFINDLIRWNDTDRAIKFKWASQIVSKYTKDCK